MIVPALSNDNFTSPLVIVIASGMLSITEVVTGKIAVLHDDHPVVIILIWVVAQGCPMQSCGVLPIARVEEGPVLDEYCGCLDISELSRDVKRCEPVRSVGVHMFRDCLPFPSLSQFLSQFLFKTIPHCDVYSCDLAHTTTSR